MRTVYPKVQMLHWAKPVLSGSILNSNLICPVMFVREHPWSGSVAERLTSNGQRTSFVGSTCVGDQCYWTFCRNWWNHKWLFSSMKWWTYWDWQMCTRAWYIKLRNLRSKGCELWKLFNWSGNLEQNFPKFTLW